MAKVAVLENARTLIRTEIVEITPVVARDWLKLNFDRNRRLKSALVAAMYRDMMAGRWALNGTAIRFDEKGQLIDGQHRLTACAQAGVPFKSLVVWGLPSESRGTIDQGGRQRTPSDLVQLAHGAVSYPQIIAGVAGMMIRAERNEDALHPSNITPVELEGYVRENFEELSQASALGNSLRRLMPPNLAGYAGMILTRISAEMSLVFFDALGKGEIIRQGQPVYALRQRFLNGQQMRKTVEGRRMMLALTFKAWNYERAAKEDVQTLRWVVRDEEMPEPR